MFTSYDKMSAFILFLIGINYSIKKELITTVPKEIYNEFVIVFFFTSMCYFILENKLNNCSRTFRNINPEHKKMYVVKNFIKSLFLAGLCTQLGNFSNLMNGTINLLFVKRCAIYYIMNDVIGLILVKKLPLTTKMHHITTTLCGFAIMAKETNCLDILTLIVVYAVFSSIAFCVNFYLGLRIYSTNIALKRYLSNISFWTYLLSCIVNWILQTYLANEVIKKVPYHYTLFYFIFLYFVGKDDIILMKWLYDDHNKFKEIMTTKQ
jgi:hypothetical protein